MLSAYLQVGIFSKICVVRERKIQAVTVCMLDTAGGVSGNIAKEVNMVSD